MSLAVLAVLYYGFHHTRLVDVSLSDIERSGYTK